MSRRFAFLVDPRVVGALDFEPGLGARRRDELDDGGMVCERPAAQFWVMWQNRRCSILFHFDVPGDSRTLIVRPVSSASFCSSSFQSRAREPFEPPQSAVIVNSSAFG